MTGVAADEKNIADVLFIPGQWHFIDGLQFLLGEINLDNLVAVFNLLLDNGRGCSLIIRYAVNEGDIDKSFLICQMLVDHLCHAVMPLQIVDVARHKRTVYVRPPELVQWIEAFIDADLTSPRSVLSLLLHTLGSVSDCELCRCARSS